MPFHQTIKIDWQMTDPPVVARKWRDIARFGSLGGDCDTTDIPAEDVPVESSLGLPPGTIRLLRSAFVAGLNRFDGWDAAGTASAAPATKAAATTAASRAAARIYKRGVPWRDGALSVGSAEPAVRSGSYNVVIYPETTPAAELLPGSIDFLIIDSEVHDSWDKSLWASTSVKKMVMRLPESEKTLASVAKIMVSSRAARAAPAAQIGPASSNTKKPHWCVVGGGVLTDVAAFAAGLCGADITFIPTTLLAMADACIGGKTGVNFPPWGKNQVGLFYFPREVRVWPGWLKTLPPRHFAAGVAECIKHTLLVPGLTAQHTGVQQQYLDRLAEIIQVKADVVADDPAETGRRATLNLGHTLAHALEAEALDAQARGAFIADPDLQILHGEAVAVGLAYAAILSQMKCGLPEGEKQSIFAQLKTSGCWLDLPTLAKRCGSSSLQWSSVWERMCGDKKQTTAGTSSTDFVLLAKIGAVYREGSAWTVRVSESEAAAAWSSLMAALAT